MISGISYVVGFTSINEAYIIRAPAASMDLHRNTTTSSDILSQVSSGANYEISTSPTLGTTIASFAPTQSALPTLLSPIISVSNESMSDIAYYNDEVNIGTVSASTTGSVSTDFTCSISGSTAITYSITETDHNAGPS